MEEIVKSLKSLIETEKSNIEFCESESTHYFHLSMGVSTEDKETLEEFYQCYLEAEKKKNESIYKLGCLRHSLASLLDAQGNRSYDSFQPEL